MKKFFILLAALFVLVDCNNATTSEEASEEAGMPPVTLHGADLLNEVGYALTIGQSIFEYGSAAQALQQEMLLFVDTCQDRQQRFINRRLAKIMSVDMMNSVMDDSLQLHYYLDSILFPYQQVDSHWFIQGNDSMALFTCEAYHAEDEVAHVVKMNLIFRKYAMSAAVIEYPNDIHSPSIMFASDEDFPQADEVFSVDDDEIVILRSEENDLLMLVPMDMMLPAMLSHSWMILTYMSNEGDTPDEVCKPILFSLSEFQRQYAEWQNASK